jgi:putative addiction module antidote
MLAFKITSVGSSVGIILTKEVQARLKVKKGDMLYMTESPDGSYRLTPYSPDFEEQMKFASEIMHDDREILKALSK